MNFLSDFGVQPFLLAAQAVNFLVLLLILNRFLYKPVLKTLKERKDKIAESLREVAEIEKRLAKTAEESEAILEKAAKEAREIVQSATESGTQIISEAHVKAAANITVLVAKSEQQMRLELDRQDQEIKEELANMVAEGLRVISGKVLTDKDKKDLLNKSVKEIN